MPFIAFLPPYISTPKAFPGIITPLEYGNGRYKLPFSFMRLDEFKYLFLLLYMLFPGLTVLILGSIALYKLNRRSGLYLLLGGFAFWASLGPSAGLYRWLHGLVPGVSGLRVPARFSIYVFFALSASYFARRPKTLLSGASVLAAPLLWGALFFLLPASISGGVVLPAIALYLLGTEIINAPHHLGLPQYGGDTKLPLWEQFRIARTCVYPRWLARFVVLNFNYHAEHHMFPDLAWYELPLAHEAVRVIFAHGYHEDPQFAWVLRNRRRALLAVITQREEGVTEKLAA